MTSPWRAAICLLAMGCAHSEPPRTQACVGFYRRGGGGKGGTEYYTVGGAPAYSPELRARLLAEPASHDRAVLARRLWRLGWVFLALDTAVAITGFTLWAVSPPHQAEATGLEVGGILALVPTLAGFFGGSRAAFHRAMDQYNLESLRQQVCPTP